MRDDRPTNYLYQFIPRYLEALTTQKKIEFQGHALKTAYLINIAHELVLKYYFTQEVNFNLWSVILREKYGVHYHYYIDYLVDQKLIHMISNYYGGKKARTYKLNVDQLDVMRCKVQDKVLLKKYEKDYLARAITAHDVSPLAHSLRKLLIEDLYHVQLNYAEALNWLNAKRDQKEIELNKYFKNLSSIDAINTTHIFYKFDAYGRMHTNFTILKRYIRHQCLQIDGQEVMELDVKNSQPFFFGCLLVREIGRENFNDEVRKYIECVKNGLLYDELLAKYPDEILNRDQAKMLVYKVLFGTNMDKKWENRLFRGLYPTVYEYIKELKSMKDSYKELSHALQKLESDFIYGGVVAEIKAKLPQIRLFTVHDSLVFPQKYKEEVSLIFKKHLKALL